MRKFFHGMFLRDSRVQNIVIRFLTWKVSSAKVTDEGLVANKGKQVDWWKSLSNDVVNASPF